MSEIERVEEDVSFFERLANYEIKARKAKFKKDTREVIKNTAMRISLECDLKIEDAQKAASLWHQAENSCDRAQECENKKEAELFYDAAKRALIRYFAFIKAKTSF